MMTGRRNRTTRKKAIARLFALHTNTKMRLQFLEPIVTVFTYKSLQAVFNFPVAAEKHFILPAGLFFAMLSPTEQITKLVLGQTKQKRRVKWCKRDASISF